jgi:hypothetical protein
MVGKCGGEMAFQKALDTEDVFEFKDPAEWECEATPFTRKATTMYYWPTRRSGNNVDNSLYGEL